MGVRMGGHLTVPGIPIGHLFKGNTVATNLLIDVKCNSETNPIKFFRGSKKRRSVFKTKKLIKYVPKFS